MEIPASWLGARTKCLLEGVSLKDISHSWMKCEPDNDQTERCLVLDAKGDLVNARCNETLPYVCFKKTVPGMAMSSCGTPDKDARKQDFRCDYEYFKEADGYLKYHEMPADWHEAQLRCHMEGSVLASPINKSLRTAMETLANRSSVCGAFTGIHSRFSRGDMFSVEGVPLSIIPHTWAPNEPDNDKDEEGCIAMLKDGSFADYSCFETLPYMCWKKASPGMKMNFCGTTDDAYNFDGRTKSCYKFHRYPRTWSRAYMTCAAEGAHLAIINSETEATVIRELFSKNPNIANVGDYVRDVANIGFHDWNEHGEWRTIHGQTLAEAGYDKFSPGEPNNYTIQYCGAVYRSGLFDDMWCDRRAAFICEKDPEMLTCPDDKD